MKLRQLTEKKQKQGSYIGVKYTKESKQAIAEFTKKNKIPDAISPNKLHSTVVYSRKHVKNIDKDVKKDCNFEATVKGFEVWETQGGNHALVMKLTSPELTKRHSFYYDKYDEATYDYDEYKPHITLSYDVGEDFDPKSLKWDDDTPLIIDYEYFEPLDTEWTSNNG